MLIDKNIEELCINNKLVDNFDKSKLNSVSYELSIDSFVIDGEEKIYEEISLPSLEYIYVKCDCSLNMPNDLCAMVIEKNSLMRKGLKVDGPLYQPGHKTNVYIRIFNMNKDSFVLKNKMNIAQLSFFKLNDIPYVTYDNQVGASYNDERVFRN